MSETSQVSDIVYNTNIPHISTDTSYASLKFKSGIFVKSLIVHQLTSVNARGHLAIPQKYINAKQGDIRKVLLKNIPIDLT